MPLKGSKFNPITMRYEVPIEDTPSLTAPSASPSTRLMSSPLRREGRAATPPPRRSAPPVDAVNAAGAAKDKVIDKLLRAVGAGARASRSAVRRPRQRRCSCHHWFGKRLLRDVSLAVIALGLFSCGNRDVFAGFGKASLAVAEVGEAAGNLASASANATVAITGVAVDAVVVAASAAEEAWRGIDVLNLSLTRQTCRAVGVSSYALSSWVEAGANGAFPATVAPMLGNLVHDVSYWVPAVEHTTEQFDITGTFWHYWMRCRYREDGSSVMAAWVINATFVTQWSNPLWEHLGVRVDAESRRVVEKIRLSVDKLRPLPANFGAVDDATILRDLGVGLRPSAFFWARPVRSCLLLTVLGFLGLAAVRRCGIVLRSGVARFSILLGGLASRTGWITPPEGLASLAEALQAPESVPAEDEHVIVTENDYLGIRR